MITVKLDTAKKMFFDPNKVLKDMDKKTEKALGRGGAMIRQDARRLIKSAVVKRRGRLKKGQLRRTINRGSSKPGDPPFSQTGRLRENIFYFPIREFGHWNVVVGPVRLNNSTDAPHTLEFGGSTTVTKLTSQRRIEHRKVDIEARPYMAPALQSLLDRGKLPDQFRTAGVRGD